jgi:acetyl/propionyl-CoA carboxylase alpha subunit
MRALRDERHAIEAIQGARREAAAAFGDGSLYVERLIERPRHIEFQILADTHGNILHLFERECSLQRRHQKVIEESPSTAIDASIRAKMGDAAVAAARACGYRNAGTIEFLVEGQGAKARFYFLEMNTRLQVEHPVTETVLGIDLVHAQLAVAAGEPLPWTQPALSQKGHAIECRIYAEDPSTGFLPQSGRLLLYREPSAPGIRIDSGFAEGDTIAVNYDPLIAKLIAYGESRAVALARAASALRAFPILGLKTNVPFLLRLLGDPEFRAGNVHTGYIDEHQQALTAEGEVPTAALAAAALATSAGAARFPDGRTDIAEAEAMQIDPWSSLGAWGR